MARAVAQVPGAVRVAQRHSWSDGHVRRGNDLFAKASALDESQSQLQTAILRYSDAEARLQASITTVDSLHARLTEFNVYRDNMTVHLERLKTDVAAKQLELDVVLQAHGETQSALTELQSRFAAVQPVGFLIIMSSFSDMDARFKRAQSEELAARSEVTQMVVMFAC